MSEEIKDKIGKLTNDINMYNYEYFMNNKSLISDYQYDCLLEELTVLEEKYPQYKLPNSPTNSLGERNSNSFDKVKHKVPMLSLKKTYSFEEINKFFLDVDKTINDDVTFVCELKLDGISIDAHYINGFLNSLSTRGDGKIGDNVYRNKSFITNIPLQIDDSFKDVHFRGEVLMTFKDFERYNNHIKKTNSDAVLSNPRNAASGTLKTLNITNNTEWRKLTVFFYNIIFDNCTKNEINTQIECLKFLEKIKIPISENYRYCKNKNEVFEYINYVERIKNTLNFPIDGVVIKVNEFKYYDKLGCTNKNPRWAIAYKYKPDAISTKLLNIEYNVGRSGIITPVAIFEPIELSGTIVQRATLHNEKEIKKLDLKYGDNVLVKKSGEIIPKIIGIDIIGRDINAKNIEFIKTCPSCGYELKKINDLHYCLNNSCKERLIELLTHFVSKNALNIKSIGHKTISLLISRNLVKDQSDIFSLRYKDIYYLPGFNSLSTKKFFDELEIAKKTKFNKILFSLGIPHVGEVIADNIVKYFKDINTIKNATIEQLQKVDLVGEEVAKSVFLFFKNDHNLQIIEKLKEVGFVLETNNYENSEKLKFKGLTFVITGIFANIDREEIKNFIETNGGIIKTTVSKNINFLVAGEKPSNIKITTAKKENIKIISYSDLLQMY